MIRAATAAACMAVLSAGAGCGAAHQTAPASTSASAPLTWQAAPQAYRLHDLPNDRVVLAHVLNRSSRPVQLVASRLVVRDTAGRILRSSGRYIAGYAHGLYGAFQKPSFLPTQELSRLGLVIVLAPGRSAPLTLAWRLVPGARAPASLDYGAGRLALPSTARLAAP